LGLSLHRRDFHPEYLQPDESAAQLPSSPTGLDLPLPDWTFLYEEILQYQASQLGVLFPIIDRLLYGSTIDAAYCEKYSTLSPGVHKCQGMQALSALAVHGPKGYPLQYSDQYAKSTSVATTYIRGARLFTWLADPFNAGAVLTYQALIRAS
jgi:hypothetical protein